MLREKRFLPKNALDARAKELIVQKIKVLLFSHQNIVFAYIFGSFVCEKLFRDIDMAFFIRTKLSFKLESDLSFALSDAPGYDVEMKALNYRRLPAYPFQDQGTAMRGICRLHHQSRRKSDYLESSG